MVGPRNGQAWSDEQRAKYEKTIERKRKAKKHEEKKAKARAAGEAKRQRDAEIAEINEKWKKRLELADQRTTSAVEENKRLGHELHRKTEQLNRFTNRPAKKWAADGTPVGTGDPNEVVIRRAAGLLIQHGWDQTAIELLKCIDRREPHTIGNPA